MPSRKPGRVTRSCIVVRIVAVDAGDRMRDQLARLGVRHLVHRARSPCIRSPPPSFLYGTYDRRVAVHARAGLLRRLLALGERLVVEHVGVAALLAEIHRERVAGPHRLQPRIFLEARLRDNRSRIGAASACAERPRCRRSACATCRPCACSRRTAAGSSCPRPRDRPSRRSGRRRGRTGFRASCWRWKMLTSNAATATTRRRHSAVQRR